MLFNDGCHQLGAHSTSLSLGSDILKWSRSTAHEAYGTGARNRAPRGTSRIVADFKPDFRVSSTTGRAQVSLPFLFPSQKLRTSGMLALQAGFGHVTVRAHIQAITEAFARRAK